MRDWIKAVAIVWGGLVLMAVILSCGKAASNLTQAEHGDPSPTPSDGGNTDGLGGETPSPTPTPTPAPTGSPVASGQPGPIDGAWLVNNATCNGQSLPSQYQTIYQPPNSDKFVITGNNGTLKTVNNNGTCSITTNVTITYTATTATFTPTAPSNCVGSAANACPPTCGQQTAPPSTYSFSPPGGMLKLTAINGTTCATQSKGFYKDPLALSFQPTTP